MDRQTIDRPEVKASPTPRVLDREIDAKAPAKRRRHAWLWIPILLLLCVVGYLIYARVAKSAATKNGNPGDAAARGIPVAATPSRRGDMHIYLDGLGSVVPLNTVTIRTRVDGQLMKIDFAEGQNVKEGDVLFEIDPRPFQVQLEQAEGQMAKDQALLKNARADLERYQIAL